MDVKAQLIELARLQAATNSEVDVLTAELSPLLAQVNGLKNRIKAAESVYENAVSEFKSALLDYIAETGDRFAEISEVTFRKRTKWTYDEDEALGWAMENAPEDVKHSLNKKLFESRSVEAFPGAEQVNIPEIALATRLGHLLIEAEDYE